MLSFLVPYPFALLYCNELHNICAAGTVLIVYGVVIANQQTAVTVTYYYHITCLKLQCYMLLKYFHPQLIPVTAVFTRPARFVLHFCQSVY